MRPEDIIKKLDLIPLPNEGGYYRQTWVSDFILDGSNVISRYGEKKLAGTAIYFLLVDSYDGFSALHTLPTTEIYHFYLGDPVQLSLFYENGSVKNIIMGQDILSNELPQFTVPPSVVQGSALVSGGKWALLGTTIAPGYSDNDFNLAFRTVMLKKYPKHQELIISLTREKQDL